MKNFKALALATTILGTTLAAGYAMNAQTGAPLTETTPTVETQVAPAPVAPIVEVAEADRQLEMGDLQVAFRNGDATFEGNRKVAGVELDSYRNRHGNMTYVMNFAEGFEVDGKLYTQITFTHDIATVTNPVGRDALQGRFSISGNVLKINIRDTNLQIRFSSNRVFDTRQNMLADQARERREQNRIEEDNRRSDWAEDQLLNNNKNGNLKEATCVRRRDLDRNTGSEWFVCQVRNFGSVGTHELSMENDNGNWAARPTFNF